MLLRRNSLSIIVLFALVLPLNAVLNRNKRWIMYPYGGQAKVVIGIAWPIVITAYQKMSCSVNLQFEFQEPQNISIFHQYPPIISSRERDRRSSETKRISDRMMSYLKLEEILTSYGMDGRNCLLRSICENAMDSVDHEGNGIYGQLLHILLSPDYGDGEVEEDLDIAYVDAQKAGYYGVDCFSLYPNCPYGTAVLDLISAFL